MILETLALTFKLLQFSVKIKYLISTIRNTVNQGVIKLAKQDPPIAAVTKLNIKLFNIIISRKTIYNCPIFHILYGYYILHGYFCF